MRNFKIILLSEALKDMKESKKWYEKQQIGLGNKFVADVKLSISALKQNPYIGSVKYLEIRTLSCSTFPFALHYSISESKEEVVITSIFHLHRKPFW